MSDANTRPRVEDGFSPYAIGLREVKRVAGDEFGYRFAYERGYDAGCRHVANLTKETVAERDALAERLAAVTAERDRWLESYASSEKELREMEAKLAARPEPVGDAFDRFAVSLREVVAAGAAITIGNLRFSPAAKPLP